MAAIQSWQLKLLRAEEHFEELKTLIGIPVVDRQNCPIREVLNTNGQFEYSIALDIDLDDRVPIVAGDVLFNVRSALDHLICAVIPSKDKGRAQFPIFTTNPFEVDPTNRSRRHPNAFNAWRTQTKGVPANAIVPIQQAQPFVQAAQGVDPQHHSLAVLKALQDADKHRQLIFSKPCLNKGRVFLNGVEFLGFPGSLGDGTIFAIRPQKMNVEVDGVIAIPFGVGNGFGYEYPLVFEMILAFVRNEVFPALESFAL